MPMQIRGISVSLVSEGEEIQRYQEKEEDEVIKTCYVPSQAGKEFEVCYVNGDYPMGWLVIVDGRRIQSFYQQGAGAAGVIRGRYPSLTEVEPFRFAELELTEDTRLLQASSGLDLNKLGWVEVIARRAKPAAIHPEEKYEPASISANIGPVPEKAKKIGWHTVSLGKRKRIDTAMSTCGKIDYLDTEERPYAKFRFHYQPPGQNYPLSCAKDHLHLCDFLEALLQAQGIMPISRTSRRSPSPEKEDSAADARIRALQDSIKVAEVAKKAAEAELAKLKPTANKRVKREITPISLSGASGDVIDLSSDDD